MSSCLQDSDCGRLNYCDLDNEICTHNDIFPVQGLDIIAYILIAIFLGLQNIGGLGAGTIKVFVFMIILNYSMKESTSYTYPILLASKIADNIVAIWRKHPVFTEKPLIDYKIAMIFLPSVLCGAKLGASFSNSTPNIVLQILLIFFVTKSFIKTAQKVNEQWKIRKLAQQKEKEQIQQKNQKEKNKQQQNSNQDKNSQVNIKVMNEAENQKQNEQNDSKTESNSEQQDKQSTDDQQSEEQNQVSQNLSVSQKIDKKYNMIIKNEVKTFPVDKIVIILSMFIFLMVYYILMGGKKTTSPIGINICSKGYWTMWALQFVIYILFFILIVKLVKYETKVKQLANHMYVLYDIDMQKLGVSRFIINGFLCGFINGIVGFGGSVLIVPVIVGLGLHPRAATATTSFITVFQSGITTSTALISGQIDGNAFGFLFGIGFVGSFIFTGIFNKIVDHYKLQGLTIFFTALIQILLLLASIALWIQDLAQNPFSDQTKTQDFCGN